MQNRLAMPVWLHLVMCVLVQVAGAFLAMWVYFSSHIADGLRPVVSIVPLAAQKLVWLAVLVVVVLAGMFAPLFSIMWFVPARCSSPGCGGRARLVNNVPYTYRCSRCGHVRRTRMFQGGGRR